VADWGWLPVTQVQTDGNLFSLLGCLLIFAGAILLLVGASLLLARHVPFLGNLPGDIHYHGKAFEFHFPLATCVIISLVVTLIFWVIARLR